MQTEKLAELVTGALDEVKGVDITTIDVRDKTSVTDTLVIASGTSERHVRALADRVLERVRAAGTRPLGVEGEDSGDWVLVDLGDVIVHVMLPEKRDFYNLEKLWTLDVRGAAAGGD